MKRFIINCSIDQEIVEKFISCVENSSPDEKIVIYLSSNGGSAAAMYILIDIINANPVKFKIHGIEKIFSAAFELFFLAKCEKVLAPATVGMCHLAGSDMRMNSKNKPDYECDEETIKAGKFRIKDLQDLLKMIGAGKYIKKIMSCKDTYFQCDVLQEFINFQLGLQEPAKEGVQKVSAGI